MKTYKTSTHLNASEAQAFSGLTIIGIAVTVTFMISGALSFVSEGNSGQIEGWYWGIYAILGSLYSVGFFIWDDYNNNWRNWIALISLTLLGLSVMAFVRFHGLILFLLMPITMQSALFLSRRGVMFVTFCIVLMINLLPYVLFQDTFATSLSLWLSNAVTIGGLYGVGIVIQIALIEQFKARAEVEYLNTQLRDYAKQSADLATAKERNRMAHTIHDSIGHALTVVSVQLEAAERLIERDEIGKANESIKTARQVTKEGLSQVRASVKAWQSEDSMISVDLSEALQSLIDRIQHEDYTARLQASLQTLQRVDTLPNHKQAVILRAMQEALTNALKHAKPKQILLNIDDIQDKIIFEVTNDRLQQQSGFGNRSGLENMNAYIQSIGGTLIIQASTDTFTLILEIPYV